MAKRSTLIAVASSIALVAGIFFTLTNVAAAPQRITLSQGLTLEDVLDARESEAVREEKGLQTILVFDKSGGSLLIGNFQPALRVDLPVDISHHKKEVSLQYFVDISTDVTPSPLVHCSDVRLHVYVDSKEVYVTDWLGYEDRDPAIALQTEKITIGHVSPGDHSFGLIPEGRIGGCNVDGYILSWGGTAAVFQ